MGNQMLKADVECRIDKFISDNAQGISRSFAGRLIDEGLVRVNGKVVKQSYKLKIDDMVLIEVPAPVEGRAKAEEIPLDIVYEDRHLLVVNKPRGMVVHPAAGNYSGTLVNALLAHCEGELSQINGVVRPGIVHRIDKDTTGLLLVAKSNEAHLGLVGQIKDRSLTRSYIALVHGNVKQGSGVIDAPIGRHARRRKEMTVRVVGRVREAVTMYEVVERFGAYTLVRCRLRTGRTHQIRVHMSHIGHAIVGDKVYGVRKEKFDLEGQLLHAQALGFVHPVSGEYMEFGSELPEDFERIIKILRR